MSFDKQWVVNLKGKDYVVYAGVLDAATKAGLKSLTTRVIQIPTPENGHMAVVMARAEFEDGRVFEDVGDASPATCSAHIAAAALRMASTRGKGRVLRDAINLVQTLFEELPDLNGHTEEYAGPAAAPSRAQGTSAPPASNGGTLVCSAEGCGALLTKGQYEISMRKLGEARCPAHQKTIAA